MLCPYCIQLKELLDNEGIKYIEINVDSEVGGIEFASIQKVAKSDMLPMVIVGNKVLVPDIGFRTILECFEIILKLMGK